LKAAYIANRTRGYSEVERTQYGAAKPDKGYGRKNKAYAAHYAELIL